MPRFDWAGIEFKKMNIKISVVPISFFKHYDGYGHITGIRTNRLFSEEVLFRLNTSSISISSAYREYLEVFYIYFRDSLIDCKYKGFNRKAFFIDIAEHCFNFFLNSNLRTLYRNKMTEEQLLFVIQEIRELFYFDFNLIYGVIQEDVNLNSRYGLASKIKYIARSVVSTLSSRFAAFEYHHK